MAIKCWSGATVSHRSFSTGSDACAYRSHMLRVALVVAGLCMIIAGCGTPRAAPVDEVAYYRERVFTKIPAQVTDACFTTAFENAVARYSDPLERWQYIYNFCDSMKASIKRSGTTVLYGKDAKPFQQGWDDGVAWFDEHHEKIASVSLLDYGYAPITVRGTYSVASFEEDHFTTDDGLQPYLECSDEAVMPDTDEPVQIEVEGFLSPHGEGPGTMYGAFTYTLVANRITLLSATRKMAE
jgi:hypothetical protein